MAVDFSFLTDNNSVFELLLPFVLIFTIIFAILQATKILGAKKNIDAIIAIVFGLLLIRSTVAVQTINRFLPNVSLAIIVVLMILLLLGIFLGKEYKWASGMKGIAALLSAVVVLWIFSGSSLSRFGIPNVFGGLSSETKGIIVFIVVLIIIVSFVSRDESKKKGGGDRLKDLGKSIFED